MRARIRTSERSRAWLLSAALIAAVSGSAPALRRGAWLSVARAQGEAQRIDGLAAVVGGGASMPGVDAVLISDVELRAHIAWSGAHPEAELLTPLPNSVLQSALNEVVGELLIAREAVRVRAEAPASGEIERERARLVASAGGANRMHALLDALGATDDELDVIARRRASVGAFLSANLQGVTVVTDSEIERVLDAEADAYAGRDRATVQNELRARMSREALDGAIERWVTVLRSRTPVRLYVQY
jgi:hypothetical protein